MIGVLYPKVPQWTRASARNLFRLVMWVSLLDSGHLAAQHTTLGPGSCGGDKSTCHASEFKNQVDKHANSLDEMSSDNAKKYANISGAGLAGILKGTSKCMSCHGTPITDKRGEEVEDGVSCECCHGPASGYKDVHQQKGNYNNSILAGMRDLRNLDVRAAACIRCHLTTDQDLLRAGHPSGLNFFSNPISRIKPVAKHWKRALRDDDKDKKPYDDALKARGPLPNVVPVQAQNARSGDDKADNSPKRQNATVAPATQIRSGSMNSPFGPAASIPINLEPFPQLSDSASVDSILLVVKKRLELLYKKINPAMRY